MAESWLHVEMTIRNTCASSLVLQGEVEEAAVLDDAHLAARPV